MKSRRHIVVCYDVSDDRKRTRLQKLLRKHLEHVQKSVFEGPIDERRLVRLRQGMLERIDPSGDTIRIYTLCAGCRPATEILGRGGRVEDETGDRIV